jgi:hypothetical protein
MRRLPCKPHWARANEPGKQIKGNVRGIKAQREALAALMRWARPMPVPETIEASLQLSEAALLGLGVPAGLVIASVYEQRDVFRAELRGSGVRRKE